MTIHDVIKLCGGYDYSYILTPRERSIGYFHPNINLEYPKARHFFKDHPELLSREVAHITAVAQNTFRITYYVAQEDKA